MAAVSLRGPDRYRRERIRHKLSAKRNKGKVEGFGEHVKFRLGTGQDDDVDTKAEEN